VKGVHLTLNDQGKPSGQALIEMADEGDVSKALEKHRQYLGLRYVEGFITFPPALRMNVYEQGFTAYRIQHKFPCVFHACAWWPPSDN